MKRGRADSSSPSRVGRKHTNKRVRLTLEGALSEETLLRCLSFLNLEDLLTVTLVSKGWNRLAQEPSLWKHLYLSTFSSARSGSRTPPLASPVTRTRPWKALFMISMNWRRGRARPSLLRRCVLPDALPIDLTESPHPTQPFTASSGPSPSPDPTSTDLLLQFHQQYFVTASRTGTGDAAVSVYNTLVPTGRDESVLLGKIVSERFTSGNKLVGVTELRLDEAPRNVHSSVGDDLEEGKEIGKTLILAVFYSTSDFSLFRLHLPTTTASFAFHEIFKSPSPSATTLLPSLPVITARLYSPLLVTVDTRHTLRFWRIVPTVEPPGVDIIETDPPLRSYETMSPIVLSLSPIILPPSPDAFGPEEKVRPSLKRPTKFKVSLAYSKPIFPSSWTVGVQEFTISIPSLSSIPNATVRPLCIRSRHALAIPTSAPRRFQRSVGNLGTRAEGEVLITSLDHSDPWLIASKSDNTIECFKVLHTSSSSLSTSNTSSSSTKLEISPRRTLFGHTASVDSVAVSGLINRCVSGGADGRVRVWDLNELNEGRNRGEAIEVIEDGDAVLDGGRIRRVAFDESKIVGIVHGLRGSGEEGERVKVLRFD